MKFKIQGLFFTVKLLRIPLKMLFLCAHCREMGLKTACTAFGHLLWIRTHIFLLTCFRQSLRKKNLSYTCSKSRIY